MFKIYFVKVTRGKKFKKRKTPIYTVRKDSDKSLGELLGVITFDGAWRQFVFIPSPKTEWSSGCLTLIAGKLEELNQQWRYDHA
jgi:hypothetical protein